jgi:hypothetical protein
MPWLTQLAAVARRTGYPVTEVAGWMTRGHGPQPKVLGIVNHHTAGRDDMHVVRDGRPGLPGPLSQFWLRRDGRIFVIAAGRCWHNAPSTSAYHTNSNSLGIEAENNGREAWPSVQLDAYKRLDAELCKEFGLPVSRVRGHKEINSGKPDPHSVNMADFRAAVARLIEGDDDMPLTDAEITKIADRVADRVWREDTLTAPGLQAGETFPAGPDPKNKTWMGASFPRQTIQGIWWLGKKIDAIAAAGGVDVDEAAIVQGVLAGLPADKIAAAVVAANPPDEARRVVDELSARLGRTDAEG